MTHWDQVLKALKRRKKPASAREIADSTGLSIVRVCGLLKDAHDGDVVVRSGTRCKYRYQLRVR